MDPDILKSGGGEGGRRGAVVKKTKGFQLVINFFV